MLPSEALAKIEKDAEKLIDKEATTLFTDLETLGVRDTGFFEGSWRLTHIGVMRWRISNNAEYAIILARGRRTINGRAYGSKLWANGLSPMLAKTDKNIQRGLDAIRY